MKSTEICADLGYWKLEALRARRHGTCRTFFLKLLLHMQENLDSATISTLQCIVVLMYHDICGSQ